MDKKIKLVKTNEKIMKHLANNVNGDKTSALFLIWRGDVLGKTWKTAEAVSKITSLVLWEDAKGHKTWNSQKPYLESL